MPKLRLEDLSVESFATSDGTDERGTVVGQSGENTCWAEACQISDDDFSCAGGCRTVAPANTCFRSCDYHPALTCYGYGGGPTCNPEIELALLPQTAQGA